MLFYVSKKIVCFRKYSQMFRFKYSEEQRNYWPSMQQLNTSMKRIKVEDGIPCLLGQQHVTQNQEGKLSASQSLVPRLSELWLQQSTIYNNIALHACLRQVSVFADGQVKWNDTGMAY